MKNDLQSLEVCPKWQLPTGTKGAGIGLRSRHYQDIITKKPEVNWFEVISDNYFCAGGLPLFYLEKIRQDYPISLHGVGMSLGSTDPLNLDY